MRSRCPVREHSNANSKDKKEETAFIRRQVCRDFKDRAPPWRGRPRNQTTCRTTSLCAKFTPLWHKERIQRSSVVERSAVNAKRAFFASERSMSERVGNAFFTCANANLQPFQNFQREKPRIDSRPVKMAGEKKLGLFQRLPPNR